MKTATTTFFRWIIDHPLAALAAVTAAVALLLPRVGDLRLESDMAQFLPRGDPRTAYYRGFFTDTFGGDILTVVTVKVDRGDVFTRPTLQRIRALSDGFEALEGVLQVKSLATVHRIRGRGDDLDTRKLMIDIPEAPTGLAEIRADAMANPTFTNYILSADGKVAAINIYTHKPESDPGFEQRIAAQIDRVIAENPGPETVIHVGSPRANSTFMAAIRKDQVTVNMVTLAVVVALLYLAYRSIVAVILPMVSTALSVAAALGFLSLMGYPITPYTALVPGLLLVIGSTEDMHILSHFRLRRRDGLGRRAAVLDASTHCLLPVTLTSLTTVIGFGTLSLNETVIIRQFGIVMAFGLAVNWAVTIVSVPALLIRVPESSADNPTGKPLGAVLDWIVAVTSRRQGAIALVTAAVTAAAVAGTMRVTVNNDYNSFFKAGSPFKRDLEQLSRDLSGMNVLNIVVSTGASGDAFEPDVLKRIEAVQQAFAQTGHFRKSVSLADFIKLMNREMNGGRREMAVVPDSRATIAQYMLLMDVDMLSDYVDADYRHARILVLHDLAGSRELERAVHSAFATLGDRADRYVKAGRILPMQVTLTGMDYLIKSSGDAIVTGQVESLALALGIIFILMALVFMSVKAGMVAIVGNCIPILINFGVMGWLAIPLNTSTSMVALIALGIAVDDTIHFMVRYQRELRTTNDQSSAMANTIRAVGQPVTATSIALALGFATVMLSQFPPSAQFGLLSALVMVTALLADLLVNPVLLLTVQLITVWDYVSVRFTRPVIAASQLFRGLRLSEAKKVVLLGSLHKAGEGEVVCRQGAPGEAMFLILAGRVDVSTETARGSERLLDTMGPGRLFGEMAFLTGGRRTATVEAAVPVELLQIDYRSLERVRLRNPKIAAKLYLNMARILGERVSSQNTADD